MGDVILVLSIMGICGLIVILVIERSYQKRLNETKKKIEEQNRKTDLQYYKENPFVIKQLLKIAYEIELNFKSIEKLLFEKEKTRTPELLSLFKAVQVSLIPEAYTNCRIHSFSVLSYFEELSEITNIIWSNGEKYWFNLQNEESENELLSKLTDSFIQVPGIIKKIQNEISCNLCA